jgi:hypothetical protein
MSVDLPISEVPAAETELQHFANGIIDQFAKEFPVCRRHPLFEFRRRRLQRMGIWYKPPVYRSEHLWFATSFARHDQGDPVPATEAAIGQMCTTLAIATTKEIYSLSPQRGDDAELARLTVEPAGDSRRMTALDYCREWGQWQTAVILSDVAVEPVAA